MKKHEKRTFRLGLLTRQPMYSDGEICLKPLHFDGFVPELDCADSYTFEICDANTGESAGEIAFRAGEGAAMYYLGHIGYHIDPPFRGKHWAYKACRLLIPFMQSFEFRSVVITTDTDNYPSIRVCERLGCKLESTVPVPAWCRAEFELSDAKNRYVLSLR